MMPISRRPGQCATPSHYGWVPPRLIRSVTHTPHGVLPHLVAPMLPQIRAAMATPTGRDELIASWLADPDAITTLAGAAQAVTDTDPIAGQLCAALAVVALRHRSQPLALLAIDRALRVDPGNPLPHLLYSAWLAGITPDEIQALIAH